MKYQIINKTRNNILSSEAKVAHTFLERMVGLLGKNGLSKEEGLIFYNAPSIHMFFMKFAIDVVFVDQGMKVVKIVESLTPWRMAHCYRAHMTIELASGVCREKGLQTSDTIEVKQKN